jgi:hypothetical protein
LKAKERLGLSKEQKEEVAISEKVRDWLEAGNDVRAGEWSAREVEWLNTNPMITAKPVVYLVNLTEKAYTTKKSKWLPKVAAWVAEHGGGPVIPFSGAYESRLADMPDDEAAKAAEEAGAPSALPKIIRTGFAHIQLIYFFTAGEDEVKCWQVRKGTKAPQAAGTIHTDFERGFICAEVMGYETLKECGTESAVKVRMRDRELVFLGMEREERWLERTGATTHDPHARTPITTTPGRGQVPAGGQDVRGGGRRHHLLQVQRHVQRVRFWVFSFFFCFVPGMESRDAPTSRSPAFLTFPPSPAPTPHKTKQHQQEKVMAPASARCLCCPVRGWGVRGRIERACVKERERERDKKPAGHKKSSTITFSFFFRLSFTRTHYPPAAAGAAGCPSPLRRARTRRRPTAGP